MSSNNASATELKIIHSDEIVIIINRLGVPFNTCSGGVVHGLEKVVKVNGKEAYTEKHTWLNQEYKPNFAELLHSFEKAVLFDL